jgi:hypothetical protein
MLRTTQSSRNHLVFLVLSVFSVWFRGPYIFGLLFSIRSSVLISGSIDLDSMRHYATGRAIEPFVQHGRDAPGRPSVP